MRVTILSPLTPRFYCDKAVLLVELSKLVVRAQHLNEQDRSTYVGRTLLASR